MRSDECMFISTWSYHVISANGQLPMRAEAYPMNLRLEGDYHYKPATLTTVTIDCTKIQCL